MATAGLGSEPKEDPIEKGDGRDPKVIRQESRQAAKQDDC